MLNIVFPMAGESSRFNYQFKPFLYLDNRMFIEHTLEPFINYDSIINSYNFIVTQEQETTNNVTETLNNIFTNISTKINVFIISEKTNGPYQTIQSAFLLSQSTTMHNIIICDIDHSINITPIINELTSSTTIPDIIIPLWNITEDEHKNWGKVLFYNNKIQRFCEKETIQKKEHQEIYGLIGCYYFKNNELLPKNNDYINFSDFFCNHFNQLNIHTVSIKNAYFYGTPDMAKNTIKLRRTFETILFDVDGVLIKHKNSSNDKLEDNILLGDCVAKLKQLKENNKLIILATSRPKRTQHSFKQLLKELDITYDDIIMGLNPGPRYLINDIKPSNPLVKQSISYNVIRDKGIDDLVFNESDNYKLEIVKQFKGNSFSKTFLLSQNGKFFVRKYIIKTPATLEHYEKLKRQCDDLKRFSFYNPKLVPKILNDSDSQFDYYVDLEYLHGHKQLDTYDINTQKKVLSELINILGDTVYCYKKQNNSHDFIINFFDTKIYPKLKQFEQECNIMNYLINSDTVTINKRSYYGYRNILQKLNITNFNTEWIHPIHGDLTLENIMYNHITNDIKLIDMDGSRYVDSCYFDLGKIFQSIVSNYHEWHDIENIIHNKSIYDLECEDKYFNGNFHDVQYICAEFAHLNNTNDLLNIYKKGIFFMTTYFIRFVQFRRQVSDDHGIYAVIMATVWLNNILHIDDQ